MVLFRVGISLAIILVLLICPNLFALPLPSNNACENALFSLTGQRMQVDLKKTFDLYQSPCSPESEGIRELALSYMLFFGKGTDQNKDKASFYAKEASRKLSGPGSLSAFADLLSGYLYADLSWEKHDVRKSQRYFLSVMACVSCFEYRVIGNPSSVIMQNPTEVIREFASVSLKQSLEDRPIPNSVMKASWKEFLSEMRSQANLLQKKLQSQVKSLDPPNVPSVGEIISRHWIYSFVFVLDLILISLLFMVEFPSEEKEDIDIKEVKFTCLSRFLQRRRSLEVFLQKILSAPANCSDIVWVILVGFNAGLMLFLPFWSFPERFELSENPQSNLPDLFIGTLVILMGFWFMASVKWRQWQIQSDRKRMQIPKVLFISMTPFFLIINLMASKNNGGNVIGSLMFSYLSDTLIPFISVLWGALVASILPA